MKRYLEWLSTQTLERQESALNHLETCRKLGEEQRKSPYSEECQRLSRQVSSYYQEEK